MAEGVVLITGAGGMLGRYVAEEFSDMKSSTLGLREEADYIYDLTKDIPDFNGAKFETVIHTAGTEDNENAMALNLKGTKNLLTALDKNPPENFVYVSSYRVYSRDAGENIDEDTNTWASDETGRSKVLAEEEVRKWCEKNDITLTILRPARMFGSGVKGETLTLFNDALKGKYIHIRGNEAKVSIVCALDVAKGIRKIYYHGGIYNVADPNGVKLIELVESMTMNAGYKKRMTHLPAPWAEWVWRICRFIPSIQRNLAPDVVENRMKTLTLNGAKFADRTGINYHDTIAVIERRDKDYPYSDDQPIKTAVHEV